MIWVQTLGGVTEFPTIENYDGYVMYDGSMIYCHHLSKYKLFTFRYLLLAHSGASAQFIIIVDDKFLVDKLNF